MVLPRPFSNPDLELLNLCAPRRRSQIGIQRKGVGDSEVNRINAVIRHYSKRLMKKRWDEF